MTSNQIAILAKEETARNNRANELLKSRDLAEQQRHNLEQERVARYNAREAKRNNLTQSRIAAQNAQTAQKSAENSDYVARKNARTAEASAYGGLANTRYANETARRNVEAQNLINSVNANTQARNAAANEMNARTKQQEMQWNRSYQSALLPSTISLNQSRSQQASSSARLSETQKRNDLARTVGNLISSAGSFISGLARAYGLKGGK
nr:hypothetical protein [Picobirnavirus sp.]